MYIVLRFLFLFVLIVGSIQAQFSPGKLSKYHARYEGNANCEKCHEQGKKELSNGCIECHTPLQERITAGQGYHRGKTSSCGSCHSDHNGEEFELVYWPRDISTFDHSETGYRLSGKHIELKCAQCHKQEFITDQLIKTWAAENTDFSVLDRTFLGLNKDCQNCHTDVHKDEVGQDCAKCHNTLDWKRAGRDYDHQQARFLLTGAHQQVDCIKCHKIDELRTPKVWQLTGMAYDQCGHCHSDQHQGAYGSTCETCHSTRDWIKNLKPFDHSQTKYPTTGKHADVKCQRCHTRELTGKLPAYSQCLACHDDQHYGQFATRTDKGDCGSCHTVYGFQPTTFSQQMHSLSAFPLDGAHRTVPCNLCHKPFEPAVGVVTPQYTWIHQSCYVCHTDVHFNQFKTKYDNDCAKCHDTATFRQVTFDHSQAAFALDGKHRNVSCIECHFTSADLPGDVVLYIPLPHRCVDCHTITDQIR